MGRVSNRVVVRMGRVSNRVVVRMGGLLKKLLIIFLKWQIDLDISKIKHVKNLKIAKNVKMCERGRAFTVEKGLFFRFLVLT